MKILNTEYEVFKPIKGYEGRYWVTDHGNVWSLNKKTFRELSQQEHRNGYLSVMLSVNCLQKRPSIHRVVAESFCKNWDSILEVDHINGNKKDNRSKNLRMLTRKQNAKSKMCRTAKESSKYRGVTWDKSRNKWKAAISSRDSLKQIGRFDSEKAAAIAWNEKAKEAGYLPEALNLIED